MRKPVVPPSPHRGRIAGLVTSWRAPMRITSLLSLLVLSVASPLAVVSLLGLSAVAGRPDAFGVAPGVSDFGHQLPAPASALALAAAAPTHGLHLRRGCRWGQPGRAPYQGSTRQALQAAGLPEEVVAQIEAQRQQGRKSGRLAIARNGIRHTGDGRVFPARGFALTYGTTLCQDSSVNFAKGHVEMADLYEARDAQGRPHAVMVPDVCGNVSVLAMPAEQGKVAGMAATLARRGAALAGLADALDPLPVRHAAAGFARQTAGADGPQLGQRVEAFGTASGADDSAVGTAIRLGAQAVATRALAPGQGFQPDDPPGHQPVVLGAIGAVGHWLVPPQAAGGVVRMLGRVSAAAGRGLESLAGKPVGPGAGSPAAAGAADNTQSVPEPGSLWTVLLALAALCALRRRRG